MIRSGIKASFGQLDNWNKAQSEQAHRRQVANARFSHSLQDRLAIEGTGQHLKLLDQEKTLLSQIIATFVTPIIIQRKSVTSVVSQLTS